MRILISAGGTGGHVYPALAVADALRANRPSAIGRQPSAILWVGTHGGMEAEIVGRAGLEFVPVHGAGLHGVGLRALGNLGQLARGLVEALGVVRRFRPEALFVTGGYSAIPVALASALHGVPIVVYLPDIEPGLAVRFLARLARRVAVTADDSRAFLPGRKVVVTGYPTRSGMAAVTRERAVEHFGLDPGIRTVLVFGGSRGAHSLNVALWAGLKELLAEDQIVHITGQLDWEEAQVRRDSLPSAERARYHVFPYLHETMGLALGAADLVVSRAGASALGEFPLFGLAAILVPYPHAWRYQRVNADWLAARGAAFRLNDEDLTKSLTATVKAWLADTARLAAMRQNARALAVPDAAHRIAKEIAAVAAHGRATLTAGR